MTAHQADNARHALLVLPRLRIQNANAISSPLTHGFPSMTALMGFMWALQRNVSKQGMPIRLHRVGVICHRADEQVVDGYVKSFRLTRNPVDKDGSTAAIVEEGRMHLDITLLFDITGIEPRPDAAVAHDDQLNAYARQIGDIVARMRVAGGGVLPTRRIPGVRTEPWIAPLADEYDEQLVQFARWRRQWLPGYALVGRDDLLDARHRMLRETQPDASLLDAWLHAARFNHQPLSGERDARGRLRWDDPLRTRGSGWIVPIPVGYAALTPPQPAGSVENARDGATPFVWVESVYTMGQWISPHRLTHPHELMWAAETDAENGLYRCRSAYAGSDEGEAELSEEVLPSFD